MHGAYLGDSREASQPSRHGTISSIDLNADLGEHDGDRYEWDELLLAVVSSASIACGGHAGNAEVMEETVRRAAARGVAIGAHPSYPDREGFGRRETALGIPEIAHEVRAQVDLMLGCATQAGGGVAYVKLHGALYNRAMKDGELAAAIVECVAEADSSLVLLGLPDSELERASDRAGVRFAREGFIDRAYTSDGYLVPRTSDGAVITDAAHASWRAVGMARDKTVDTIDGTRITVRVDSLCVHGDSENAIELVTAARNAITKAGFIIAPFA